MSYKVLTVNLFKQFTSFVEETERLLKP